MGTIYVIVLQESRWPSATSLRAIYCCGMIRMCVQSLDLPINAKLITSVIVCRAIQAPNANCGTVQTVFIAILTFAPGERIVPPQVSVTAQRITLALSARCGSATE